MNPIARIMIVDDLSFSRDHIRRALSDLPITIEESSNAKEALERIIDAELKGKGFSIVFSDYSMPNMTGLDLLRALQSDPNLKKIAFIMVTAHAEGATLVEALKLGATAYLNKPVNQEECRKKTIATLKDLGVVIQSDSK